MVTYADMAVRGRPPSSVPGTMVRNLAEYLGLEGLAADDETAAKPGRPVRTRPKQAGD
jgi:hypothetical protein